MKLELSLVFLLFWNFSFGQSVKIDHRVFEEKDGLQLDVIRAMAFDDEGFIWLGGQNFDVRTIILSDQQLVLQRFNGKSFHNVPLPKREQNITLVGQIYKRKDGKFYLGMVAEKALLYYFDPISLKFVDIEVKSGRSWDSTSRVYNYNGKDYVLTQKDRVITLNIIEPDLSLTKLFEFVNPENRYMMDGSSVIIPFEDFCIIGDDNFPITFLDWEGKVLKRYSAETFERDRGANVTKFWMDEVIHMDDDYYAFMHQNPKLHKLHAQTKRVAPVNFENHSLEGQQINVLNDTLGNNLIVGITEEGDINFTELTDEGLKLKYSKNVFDVRPGIQLLSNDLTNDIWIGTNDKQLHHFTFPKGNVKTFLEGYPIRAMSVLDSISIVVATELDGWFRINRLTNEVSPYKIVENGIELFPNSARNILPEGPDHFWSNHGGSIIKVERNSGATETYRHYPVLCLERLSDSTLVYGTGSYNLMEFNTRTKQHRALAITDSLMMYDLLVTKDRKWVLTGTDKGLLKYNTATTKAELITVTEGFSDPFILMAEYHPKHGYLFGTRSGQIVQFSPENDSFKLHYEDDLKAGIATILFDKDSWWINTFNGVVAYDFKNGTKVRFSERDGFSHNEANRYSALKIGDELFVGTLAGLNRFKPSELSPARTNSELVLLKVRSFNKHTNLVEDLMDRETIALQKKIILPAENKELRIDFALTNNVDDKKSSFHYRLNNSDWIDLNEEQSIGFPNLAPGNFDLEIKANDFSGNRIGDSLKLQIVSKDFFYKTWWFYLLISVVLFALFLYFLKQARLRGRLQQKFSEDLLLSQEGERTRIAKELHDSVGQQLTLIKKKAQNVEQVEISTLTNNALEEVRSISRGLYPAVLKQLGLTESIEQLIYELDEETDLFFSSEIDNIDSLFNEAESLNFYRFIQESFSNIMKHSEATTVQVEIKKEASGVRILIRDNGKGFDVTNKEKQHSLGLKTLSERIRMLKGTLELKSSPGNGTRLLAEINSKR